MKGAPAIPAKYETLGEALAFASGTDAAITFLDAREAEQIVSFAAIRKRAREVAAALAARGIASGDRVALVLPTSPAFVECFFGAILAGAIPVPLYPPVRLGRMEEYHRRTAALLKGVGAAVVITDDRVRRLLGLATDQALPRLGCLTASELSGGGELERSASGTDIGLIQFSSGTTVESKPVALTHANMLANVAAIDAYIAEDNAPSPSGVSWLPLYHDMGLIGCLFMALYRPGSMTLIPPEVFLARPAIWLRAISRRRATISPAPNFAYGYCTKRVRDEEMEGVDLSSWSLALNGAEPVTGAVLQRFSERFARWGFRESALTPVYGLSEAALAVTFKPVGGRYRTREVDPGVATAGHGGGNGMRDAVSVGQPIAGVEVEIRGPEGVVPAGRVGRIYVRGPSVMNGYFQRPEMTASAIQDGWLDTGDIGFEDGDELYICGRAKELIILRGANHAPHEFEEALDGLAGVRAGCVVAVGFMGTEGQGEELALLVETEGEPPADLKDQIRSRVAEHTGIRPAAVELLAPGTLPRTSSGKLRRGEAGQLWTAGQLHPPRRVTVLGMTLEAAKGELFHARSAIRRRLAGSPSESVEPDGEAT
jgi:acyl-CoA synthetase (AMP-forming)/AMP-acid ligase II